MDQLQSYGRPALAFTIYGVVERALIISEAGNFAVNQSWIPHEALETADLPPAAANALTTHQKQMIETALAQTRGQVAGPGGAAAKLGIKSSTLESKIRSNIDKRRFKAAH
jgi:formate hydrogenlyase transcriptional activator